MRAPPLQGYVTVSDEDLRGYMLVYADGDAIARYASHRAAAACLLERYHAGAGHSVEAYVRRLYSFRVRACVARSGSGCGLGGRAACALEL